MRASVQDNKGDVEPLLTIIPFDNYGSIGTEEPNDDEVDFHQRSSSVLKVAPNPPAAVAALSEHLYGLIRDHQRQRKKPKPADDLRFRATLLSFTQSIATIALMRIPPHHGVSVAFTTSHYTGSDISVTAARAIRNALSELGFIVFRNGFNDPVDPNNSFTTGIRYTASFVRLLTSFGVRSGHLIGPPANVIAIRDLAEGVDCVPTDVLASTHTLRRYNSHIGNFKLSLPEKWWQELTRRVIAADPKGRVHKLHRGYDEHRIYLTRRFALTWERGGRLYDGFWQSMPKDIRRQLLIDGQPVVELDYSRLHPRMLYNRENIDCGSDFDPYAVPGFDVPEGVAKETFNRLLNSKRKVIFRDKDEEYFRDQFAFNSYRDAMISHLQPIAHNFQRDEGANLQKVDSELALNVIARCMDEGVAVYPVHDSFIVTCTNRELLLFIMLEEYKKMTGFNAVVK